MSDGALRLAVLGAGGKMGQAVVRLAAGEGFAIVGAAERAGSPALGRDVGDLAGAGTLGVEVTGDVASALLGADVAIDFSAAEATIGVAGSCARARVALVCGTTGLTAEGERALGVASAKVPVLWSPNMSLGVAVLAALVTAAARALEGFDVEIVETHHRLKVDAPSGTALRLVEAVKEAREGRVVTGREGRPGARLDDEIGVFAVRGGDVIGDHTVHLLGAGERLELTHRATNRELFARGALRAAKAIAKRAPGRYSMRDVVGPIVGAAGA